MVPGMDTTERSDIYYALPGSPVTVEDKHGNVRRLLHHVRHSPDGHSWGYLGSGPSELAKDILWDHFGIEPHPACYQDFKEDVVARIPLELPFEVTTDTIESWLIHWRLENPNTPLYAGDAVDDKV